MNREAFRRCGGASLWQGRQGQSPPCQRRMARRARGIGQALDAASSEEVYIFFKNTYFYYFLLHINKTARCILLFFVFCILFVDRLHAPAIQFKHRRFGVVRQQFTNSAHEELDKQRKAVCLTFFVLITLFSVPSPASPPVLRFSCSIPRYSMALLCYSVCRSLWVTSPYIPLGMNWFSC